jgi:hypothetical protein
MCYMNRETGEILTYSEMMIQFRAWYDGDDDTNVCSWSEYYKEIRA